MACGQLACGHQGMQPGSMRAVRALSHARTGRAAAASAGDREQVVRALAALQCCSKLSALMNVEGSCTMLTKNLEDDAAVSCTPPCLDAPACLPRIRAEDEANRARPDWLNWLLDCCALAVLPCCCTFTMMPYRVSSGCFGTSCPVRKRTPKPGARDEAAPPSSLPPSRRWLPPCSVAN